LLWQILQLDFAFASVKGLIDARLHRLSIACGDRAAGGARSQMLSRYPSAELLERFGFSWAFSKIMLDKRAERHYNICVSSRAPALTCRQLRRVTVSNQDRF
jgi:hypothetical protein